MTVIDRTSAYADELVDAAILPLGAALPARMVETRSSG